MDGVASPDGTWVRPRQSRTMSTRRLKVVLNSASNRLAQELARAGLSSERHARKGPASHPIDWSHRPYSVLQLTLNERKTAPEGRLWLPESTPRIAEDREGRDAGY